VKENSEVRMTNGERMSKGRFDPDRFRGCLLGLACGDAVGTRVEFSRPGAFSPVKDMLGGGPFGLAAGEWTDDTSMALCLAESLLETDGMDPVDQLQRYVRWWREGHWSCTGECFDIGNATREALARFVLTGEAFCGSTDPGRAGNGSIMRLAPVPMFFAADPVRAISAAAESSRTTHAAPNAIHACRYLTGLVVGALQGVPKVELLAPNYAPPGVRWQNEPLSPEIAEVAAGSFLTREPPQIQGSGYVVRSLEAALWALYRANSFEEGCLLAVNLGDDADTTAAVYGQLAGALWGERGLPAHWLSRLAMREEITQMANRLYDHP